MKKSAYLFSILFSIFLFLVVYLGEGNVNYRSSLNYYTIFESETILEKNSYLLINVKSDFKKDQSAILELMQILDKNDAVAVATHAYSGNELQSNYVYIYTKENQFSEQLNIKEENWIDFSSLNELRYYVLKEENLKENEISVPLINPMYYLYFETYPTRYHPFFHINEEYGPKMIRIAGINVDTMMEELQNTILKDYITSIDIVEDMGGLLEQEGIVYNLDQSFWIAMILGFFSFLMLVMTLILKERRNIVILRLHGISTFKILGQRYLPFLFQLWGIFVGVHILMLFVFVSEYSKLTAMIYNHVGSHIVGFTILIICVFICCLIFIACIQDYHNLKQRKPSVFLLQLNLALKLLISIVLMSPFSELLQQTWMQYKETIAMYQQFDVSKQRYYLKITAENSSIINQDKQLVSSIYSYLEENYEGKCYDSMNWFVLNDVYTNDSDLPVEYQDDYGIPYVVVNQNYLTSYEPIVHENGKLVDLNMYKGGVLFVPEMHKVSDSLRIYKEKFNCENIVYIKDLTKQMKTLYFQDEIYNEKVINPIIYMADAQDKESAYYMGTSFYIDTDNIDKVYTEMEEIGYGGNITFEWLYPATTREYNEQFLIFTSFFFYFIEYLFLYLLFIYQFMEVYLSLYGYKKTIEYLHGISYFDRYKEVYMIHLSIYLIASIGCLLNTNCGYTEVFLYFLIFGTLELIVSTFKIVFFEKKKGLLAVK